MKRPGCCPNCGADFLPDGSTGARPGCSGCGGLWIDREALRSGIAEFLRQLGVSDNIVPLHERPLGEMALQCPACPRMLSGIDLRGVAVLQCNGCDRLFLKPTAIDLISQRVLVSARAPKNRGPLSQNLKLRSILENPTQYGTPF